MLLISPQFSPFTAIKLKLFFFWLDWGEFRSSGEVLINCMVCLFVDLLLHCVWACTVLCFSVVHGMFMYCIVCLNIDLLHCLLVYLVVYCVLVCTLHCVSVYYRALQPCSLRATIL